MPAPDRLLAQMRQDVEEIVADAKAGRLDPRGFHVLMEETIVEYHTAASLLASGRARVIDLAPETRQRLEETIDFHLDHLDRFRDEWARSGEWKNGYAARAHLYEGGVKASYAAGQADTAFGVLPLPARPTEGSPCMANCGCRWDIVTISAERGHFDAYWRRGLAESCSVCRERERTWSPFRIRFGEAA